MRRARSIDPPELRRLPSTVLPTTISGRHIPLAAIRDAATAVYGAAVRTPLIRIELPAGPEVYLKLEVLHPMAPLKLPAPYNVVRPPPPATWKAAAGPVAS